MSKDQILEKNLRLSADFNSYVATNTDIVIDLPNNACIVFDSKLDEGLSKKNLSIAKKVQREGKKCYVAMKSKKEWIVKPFAFA